MNYSFKTYFLMLAYYNQWANNKIFSVLETLTEEQLNQDCGAYFNSVWRIINHILVGDILWFDRIYGYGTLSSNYTLDYILCDQLIELKQQRQWYDEKLLYYIKELDDSELHQMVTYIRHEQSYTEPMIEVLAHMFNHQAHHRGQLHSMIFQLKGQSLELDLIYFQREHSDLYRKK